MQKRYILSFIAITLISVLLIGAVSAFTLSSWLKNIFSPISTGNIVSEDAATCGDYHLVIPVSASASGETGQDYNASNAIDNDVNTHWIGDGATPYPKWITFDLGSRQCLNAVDVYVITTYIPITMDIQISDDAQSWTTLETNWQITQGNTYTTKTFTERKARYVRLYQTLGPQTSGTVTEVKIKVASLTSSSSQQPPVVPTPSTPPQNNVKSGDTSTVPAAATPSASQSASGTNAPSLFTNIPETVKELQCGSFEPLAPYDATASSQFHNYRPANAIDNNPDTHWFGDPSTPYPKSLSLDLGARRCINSLDLNVFVWDVPLTIDVQISPDNILWSTIATDWTIENGGLFVHKELPTAIARYVKIVEKSGKREYGALSEIRVGSAPFTEKPKDTSAAKSGITGELKTENILGGSEPETYYEVNGQKAFVTIDGKPLDQYLTGK